MAFHCTGGCDARAELRSVVFMFQQTFEVIQFDILGTSGIGQRCIEGLIYIKKGEKMVNVDEHDNYGKTTDFHTWPEVIHNLGNTVIDIFKIIW